MHVLQFSHVLFLEGRSVRELIAVEAHLDVAGQGHARGPGLAVVHDTGKFAAVLINV